MIIINIERGNEIKKMLCNCDISGEAEKYFESLQDFGSKLKFDNNYKIISKFCTAIGSKERLIILKTLSEKDRCVCELETILDKSQSTISHHLRNLERANLIRGYKKGNYTYYSLMRDHLSENISLIIRELNF